MELDAYLRALDEADVAQPKEIVVEVPRANDELVDALNAVGLLSFALTDGRAMTWAKVRGNPWDTHDMLSAVSELSRRLPTIVFSVTLEPDGDRGTVRGGDATGIGLAPLAMWVARHPRPRFAGTELHAELVLEVSAAQRRTVRDELARYGGLAMTIDDTPGGTGATRTIELGTAHTNNNYVASNGRWLAWIPRGRNVVRVFEALEHRRDIELPDGYVLDVAISPTGAIAYVIGEADAPPTLGVIRDRDRAQIELPEAVAVEWRADHHTGAVAK